jgi:hypothetical protein
MSRANLSVLSVSSFDGKKLLVIMSIVVVILTVDAKEALQSLFAKERDGRILLEVA